MRSSARLSPPMHVHTRACIYTSESVQGSERLTPREGGSRTLNEEASGDDESVSEMGLHQRTVGNVNGKSETESRWTKRQGSARSLRGMRFACLADGSSVSSYVPFATRIPQLLALLPVCLGIYRCIPLSLEPSTFFIPLFFFSFFVSLLSDNNHPRTGGAKEH